jgi:hypothetical protein
MQPVLVTAQEDQPGHYTASMSFTMAGDWFLLATVILPNGRVLQRQYDVTGVRPPDDNR